MNYELTWLDLSDNKISTIEQLTHLQLEYLNIAKNKLPILESLQFLSENSTAKDVVLSVKRDKRTFSLNGFLDLSLCGITSVKQIIFAFSDPKITEIDLSYNMIVDFHALKGGINLLKLDIIGNPVKAEDITAISKLPRLKALSVGIMHDEIVRQLPFLETLDS